MHERISEKNKAGIVTLYHANYNFGGLLQAYALPQVLKEYFGIEAEQIDYVPAEQKAEIKRHSKNKNILLYLYQMVYNFGIVFFGICNKKNLTQRKKAFDNFMNEIPHSEMAFEYDSIYKSLGQYRLFICGGDQIWNDCKEKQNLIVYTLQFVPSCVKKIAYAPSMAVLETSSDFRKIMSNGINQLDAVSVREKKSVSILKMLTNKKMDVVVDPVLLLTKNEWADVARTPEKKEKYILCYLLGDSMEYRKATKKFAQKIHLSILTFPHIFLNVVRKCDLFFGDIHDYTSGPREFIGLIKNAEFVITDSFHACVFSMIFEKPFVVFERNKIGEKGNMNSRIYDFLEEYHLENQLVTEKKLEDMNKIPEIDFTYAHEHWKKRREESLEYLENALKNN